jgi:kojibiose phosphorylase
MIKYNSYSISTSSHEVSDFIESVFFQGNGYMGVRGFSCEDESSRPHQKGVYISGVFDQLKPGITDIVNTPNFLPLTVSIDGQPLTAATLSGFCQALSFSDGVLTREYIAAFGDKHLQVKLSRFLSLSDVHTTGIRMELTPLDFENKLVVTSSLDASSCNLPIADDQAKKNFETVRYLDTVSSVPSGCGGYMAFKTKATGITLVQAFGMLLSDNIDVMEQHIDSSGNNLDFHVSFSSKRGEKYTVDKLVTVYTSRYAAENQIEETALKRLSNNLDKGYCRLSEENEAEWRKRWETSDITIDGDEKAQCAIRYSIFQLIGNNACDDSHVSIGARGLTHARYKGCYFWDTEIFMLPFYIYTNPAAARSILLYRYNTLDAAREHAKKMSSRGARYPWMASFDGSEQCESWDIGSCEVHVTCDVAFAMDRYIRATGDIRFLLDYAAEVYIETARFWESRFTYDERLGRYNMLFVKGPDEYCGAAQNNAYTNILACFNLNLALDTLKFLEEKHTDVYHSLVKRLNLEKEETARWREIAQKAVIPYDNEKDLYLQDDNFMLLEPLDVQSQKTGNTPLYHRICFDRLQRYRVLKQADLLLLMTLLPERFTMNQKKAAWDFYEPITLHDSTLSYGIHALLASRLGYNEKAWDYLYKSLYLDLENIMENTGTEGLHIAALGAAWQAVVLGFAGLSFENDMPKISPNLPERWECMQFTLFHKGRRLRVKISKNGGCAEYLD